MLAVELFFQHALFLDLLNYRLVLIMGNLTILQCLSNVAVGSVKL